MSNDAQNKTWNGKILKLTAKLCAMTGSSDCILLFDCIPLYRLQLLSTFQCVFQWNKDKGIDLWGFHQLVQVSGLWVAWWHSTRSGLVFYQILWSKTNITVPKLQYKKWKSPRSCEQIADRWFPVTTELSPVLWWMCSRFDKPVNLFSFTELLKTLNMIT